MPERIPIAAAKRVAFDYDCTQVIIMAWDGAKTHCITFGKTLEDCDQAAEGGNRIKRTLDWPESLCTAEPSRVKSLKKRIKSLESQIERMKGDKI